MGTSTKLRGRRRHLRGRATRRAAGRPRWQGARKALRLKRDLRSVPRRSSFCVSHCHPRLYPGL